MKCAAKQSLASFSYHVHGRLFMEELLPPSCHANKKEPAREHAFSIYEIQKLDQQPFLCAQDFHEIRRSEKHQCHASANQLLYSELLFCLGEQKSVYRKFSNWTSLDNVVLWLLLYPSIEGLRSKNIWNRTWISCRKSGIGIWCRILERHLWSRILHRIV